MKNKKMEMTLLELQEVFGTRVKVTLDESLTTEERQNENEQTVLILSLGKQMINNADIILRTEALKAKAKGLEESRMDYIIGEV